MQCGAGGAGKRRLAQRLLNLSSSFRRAENSIAWQKILKWKWRKGPGFVRNLKIYETVNYRHTRIACYGAYVTQAIINNLAPLLFTIFQRRFGVTLEEVGSLILIIYSSDFC